MNLPDDEALGKAIEHALDVASRKCGTACGQEHQQLAGWLVELRSLRSLPTRDAWLASAFRRAAEGDREGFDLMVERMDEEDRGLAVALAEQTVFEELRQRSLPRREFPFDCWHPEIRLLLAALMGGPGDDGRG